MSLLVANYLEREGAFPSDGPQRFPCLAQAERAQGQRYGFVRTDNSQKLLLQGEERCSGMLGDHLPQPGPISLFSLPSANQVRQRTKMNIFGPLRAPYSFRPSSNAPFPVQFPWSGPVD